MGASAREKMQRGRAREKEGSKGGRKAGRQAGQASISEAVLLRAGPVQGADTTDRRILLLWADGLGALWEVDSFRIFFHQHLLPPRLTQTDLTVACQTQTAKRVTVNTKPTSTIGRLISLF